MPQPKIPHDRIYDTAKQIFRLYIDKKQDRTYGSNETQSKWKTATQIAVIIVNGLNVPVERENI